MAIGVFGLQVAYKLKRTEVMSSNQTHGWFGGGSSPATVTTVDRIDFSNDTLTTSTKGSLNDARNQLAATGNSNYGWFGGGNNPGLSIQSSTNVQRVDFSNDSATSSTRGPLSLARNKLAATGNSNYGWFGGGSVPTPATYSTVDRIDFSNDSSIASVRGPLSAGRYNLAATGNSNYGWFGGGTSPTTATVDRIDFSNDFAISSVRGPLSLARHSLAATGNSNYGWFGGGYAPGYRSTVDRIDFSNDLATASVRSPLSSARYQLAATANSNYGWFGGGGGVPSESRVDRIDFSNDSSTISPRGPLSSARGNLAATSGQAKGPANKIPTYGTYGWFGGGFVNISYVDRIDFINDTNVAARGTLPTGRSYVAAAGNQNYGWFAGGYPALTNISRIDYSNDLPSPLNRGPLTFSTHSSSGAGNQNYGWVDYGDGGGFNPTKFQRINYSNDLSSTLVRGSIPASNLKGAVSNLNYGWWGCGFLSGSLYRRLDFSNDLSNASTRAPTITPIGVSARWQVGTSCNKDYGWFAGGKNGNPSGSSFSYIERISFSNDSFPVLIRSPLSGARYGLSGAGNSNYGWFGGGINSAGTNVATVERITYASDSTSLSTRTPLNSISRYGSAATSNTIRG